MRHAHRKKSKGPFLGAILGMAERGGLNSHLFAGRLPLTAVGMPLVFNVPFPFERIANIYAAFERGQMRQN
jgi:hypothetical protein